MARTVVTHMVAGLPVLSRCLVAFGEGAVRGCLPAWPLSCTTWGRSARAKANTSSGGILVISAIGGRRQDSDRSALGSSDCWLRILPQSGRTMLDVLADH